jgi:hypothetical protein
VDIVSRRENDAVYIFASPIKVHYSAYDVSLFFLLGCYDNDLFTDLDPNDQDVVYSMDQYLSRESVIVLSLPSTSREDRKTCL